MQEAGDGTQGPTPDQEAGDATQGPTPDPKSKV